MIKSAQALGCAVVLAWAFGATSTAQAQIAVTPSGMATYSYPIGVPPGVGGLAPKLALTYASGGGNGQFGMGWSISGLSVISRCAPSKAIDGVRGAITNTTDDKLCLDGKRLIPTDDSGAPKSYGIGDAAGLAGSNAYREYRTEGDSYARIRAYGIADPSIDATQSGSAVWTGPAYFKIWTKSGQVYEYGRTPSDTTSQSAYVVSQGSKLITSWLVARIGDIASSATNDNYIRFSYDQYDDDKNFGSAPNTSALSAYAAHRSSLKEIKYSGNRIMIGLGERNDKRESYATGARTVTNDRYIKITVYAAGQQQRTMYLTYDTGPASKRSVLKTIQECYPTLLKQCLPTTTFSYSAGGKEQFTANASFKSTLGTLPMHDKSGNYGVMVADFNADGKTDLLRWSKTAGNNSLLLSNGDGTFTTVPNTAAGGQFNIANQVLNDGSCVKSMVADFNGDGVPDIFRFNCAAGASNDLFLGNGDGSFTQKTVAVGANVKLQRQAHYDYCDAGQSHPCPRDYLTWSGSSGTPRASTSAWNFYVLDVNGDNKLDIIQAELPARTKSVKDNAPNGLNKPCASACTRVFLGDGQGTFAENTAAATNRIMFVDPSARLGEPGLASDLDGDQLVDFVSMWDGDSLAKDWSTHNYYTLYSKGDGTFREQGLGWLAQAPASCLPIDYNGDGKADCLMPNGVQVLSVTTGTGRLPTGNFNLTAEVNAAKAVLPLDLNGDGLDDLLLLSDTPATKANAVYLSKGDGTFEAASTQFNLGGQVLQTSDSTAANSAVLTFGDFNGTGSLQMLRMVDAPVAGNDATLNQIYSKSEQKPADLLLSVTSGLGSTNSVIYEPLTNTTRYMRDRGTANAASGANIDLVYPMYVVTSQDSDVGAGNTALRTEFSYAGLKGNLEGRGATGFREVRRQSLGADGSTKITTVSTFLQNHPYIGSVAKTVTFNGSLSDAVPGVSTALSTTTNLYCDKTSTTVNAEAGAKSSGEHCTTTAKVVRPYLLRTISEGRDLGGNALPKTTTEMSVNNTGDPLVSSVTTDGTTAGESFVKTVTNTYKADVTTCTTSDQADCKWILGRLDKTTTTSKVPNSMASIASSEGSAANAKANVGTVPAGQTQITNTQMMQRLLPILSLLLND